MSRLRAVLITGLVALAGVAVAAPSAAAQPPPQASCAGVLSSFAGQGGFRQEFAPAPGGVVSGIAREQGDLGFCAGLIFGP
jgi:hypothetical protein